MRPNGTNRLRIILPVALTLTLLFLAGFAREIDEAGKVVAERAAQITDAKVTPAAEESNEPNQKDQPKSKMVDQLPSRISEKKDQTTPQIRPVEPQLTPTQSMPLIQPVKLQKPEAQPAPAFGSKGTQIKWQVLSCGGTNGNSSSYQMGNSVSQTAVGCGSSSSYQLCQGFLPSSYQAGFVRGDANGDGAINSADVAYLINYLFVNGPAPQPMQAGDANCDGGINSADVAYLINYLFVNGPAPGCP